MNKDLLEKYRADDNNMVGKKYILPEEGEFFLDYHKRFEDIPKSEKYFTSAKSIAGKIAEVVGIYMHRNDAVLLAKVKIDGKYTFVPKCKLTKVK